MPTWEPGFRLASLQHCEPRRGHVYQRLPCRSGWRYETVFQGEGKGTVERVRSSQLSVLQVDMPRRKGTLVHSTGTPIQVIITSVIVTLSVPSVFTDGIILYFVVRFSGWLIDR